MKCVVNFASGQQSQTELRLYFGVCILQQFQESRHGDGGFACGGYSLRAGAFLFSIEPFLELPAQFYTGGLLDIVREAFTAFEQRMVTEDKDGICYQRVSLDDVLPGEEQLRRIEAIADPYAMQPQSIMEEQESRRELYDGLKRLTQREQTYLLYRYGFTDGEEHPLIGTAIYFHLTKGRAKKTEEQAMDNLWLELPWWFI